MAVLGQQCGDRDGMVEIVGLMLAAGGPQTIPARIAWPLHRALHDLDTNVRREGLLTELPAVMSFQPSPDVGLAASGANGAIFSLLQDGVLATEGVGRAAAFRMTDDALANYRWRLMRLDPRLATLVYRAATRWAALVATSAKNRSTAERSSGATRTSSTPKRLHPLPGRASVA